MSYQWSFQANLHPMTSIAGRCGYNVSIDVAIMLLSEAGSNSSFCLGNLLQASLRKLSMGLLVSDHVRERLRFAQECVDPRLSVVAVPPIFKMGEPNLVRIYKSLS
jgi:hypothetical protein